MTGRDPKVSPVAGDIVATNDDEYRVQERDGGRVLVCSAATGAREWWYVGQWQAMALRSGRVLARGRA